MVARRAHEGARLHEADAVSLSEELEGQRLRDADARRPVRAWPARGGDGLSQPPFRSADRSGHPASGAAVGRAPCTALVVRWYGEKMLCVASIASVVNPVSSYPRGRPMAMGRGAIARSIMAFLPKQRVMPLVTRYAADLRSVGVGDTSDEILAALKRVRRAGVAVAFGEVTPGAVGIAAPILDAGYPIASLCITIAGPHAKGELIDRISAEVREAARQISEAATE